MGDLSSASSMAGNLLLFALVFGMSATVEIANMKEQVRNKRAIVCGLACQFVLLPLLGFVVVFVFRLGHAVGVTLLVVTSSPGGSYSNWWCSLFNADLALSVTMTAISTMLSIILLPMNLLIYTRASYDDDVVSNLDWRSLFVSLFLIITAICIGLYCSHRFREKTFRKKANMLGNIAGLALIIFSGLFSSTGDSDSKIWSRHWSFYVGFAAPCLVGLMIANIVSRTLQLKPPERVTVAIECCYQNTGIAASVALAMFKGSDLNQAMGVPFLYGVAEILFIGIYCVFSWKTGSTKSPANVSFWKMITTSYEIEDTFDVEKDGDSTVASSTVDSQYGVSSTDYE